MSEKKKVPFTVHAGAPVVVEVTGADGLTYEVSVTISVFGAYDTGLLQPAVQPDTGTVPQFQIQAQVATQTTRKS